MITLEEFLKRWPGRVDQTTKDEIQLFIDTVTDPSGDYEAFVSRLRATGKFKSIFGDFGANAHRTPNMNYMTNILSSKERAEYPSSLYKTLTAIADGRKPSGLAQALSDVLAKQNPLLDIPGDATHRSLLIPLESLLTRKAQNVTTTTAGGFLIANDIGHQIEFALRLASVCIRAGARVLPGLRSDLTLGRETQEVTCAWLAELEEAQLADSEYGVVHFTPHRLAGLTSISVFVANPDVREKWRTVERFSGGGRALWEDGNICAGRNAYVITNCPSTKICAGDFTKMIFPTWGEGSPVAVIIDPFTAKKEGKLEILVSLMGDAGVLREEVFCISTDSAIQ